MIVALILAGGLAMQGIPTKAPKPPSPGEIADQRRLETCVDMIAQDPEEAYEQAMAWGRETGAPEAKRCAALAMIGRGEPATGAQQLEQLAKAEGSTDMAARGEMLVAAGNAWLLAEQPKRALAAFDAALKLGPGSLDVLSDRSRAYAMMGDWAAAEGDCNVILKARPKDELALTMRARARLEQGAWDLALKDAEAALALDKKNELALFVRGAAIDGKRKAGKSPS
jgi:tetratricopeptide (TPR) repeat protein